MTMQILIIEDDSFFRKFYAAKLEEKGFSVITAEDGDDGLEKAQTVNPDVILLDIIMPKKDGFEFLTIAMQNTFLIKIPVIVFSSLGQEQDVDRAKKLGAKDFINKSLFDFDTLVAKILTVANKKT